MKRLILAALAAAAALPASAQFQKPEDAVKYRQAAFTLMGSHFSRIGAMVNNRAPFDADAARQHADLVAALAKLPYTAFGEGTDKAGNTRAKAEVWKEPEKFRAAAGKMQEEVLRLQTAARSGNLDQLKAAFGPAAQSCKSCHDQYRRD